MSAPLLEARQLGVDIGGKTVVDRLNLSLQPGESLAILGRNGAGKSTLLSTLAGLRPPRAGAVLLDGEDCALLPPRQAALRRGWLGQFQSDPFGSTVLETALTGRHPHLGRWDWESKRDAELARGALKALGLAGMEARQVHTLSGGERQRLDLARCGRDALATLLERRLQNLVVESVLPEPGPTIKADPAQVQQLLRCLLANAEESLAPAGGTIRVEVSLIPAAALPTQHRLPVDFEPLAASYACVSILDTGCGITEENLGRIFDPFFTTKFHGRGRGLALVLGIARAHDAAVAVSSRPGEGSVFQVFFPSPPAAED